MFEALIYDDESQGWLRFSSPLQVLQADRVEEVEQVLEAVDSAASQGRYAVGYVSYEAASAFDPALVHQGASGRPLALFALFERAEPAGFDIAATEGVALDLEPTITRQSFESSIRQIKALEAAGDTYQVNFTHPLEGKLPGEPAALFRQLVPAQPSSFSAWLETDDEAICCISPELFFRLEGDRIETEPMKGTRPRGRFPAEDAGMRTALAASAKDRAENLMIVDMIRNDLGKIAKSGSVKVDALFSLRKLPTVWQQVSRISAETDASLLEIFRALFPCASITGAPKARTMEIIRDLEKTPRGVYTGAIGLVRPGRKACFSVAIRTLTVDKATRRARYGVGGGIVWDSDPAEEWQESLTKAKVLSHRVPEFRLLETMRYDPGEGIFLLDRHLERLQASAAYFDYVIEPQQIADLLQAITAGHPLRLRLLLSRSGEIDMEQFELVESKGPVKLRMAPAPVQADDVFLFHKTTNRGVYERAKAGANGECDDVILWNAAGELTETTIANLFLEIDGDLLTPRLEAGLLAGTYRQMLLDTGEAKEATLVKADLERATAIYVANSVRGRQRAVYLPS